MIGEAAINFVAADDGFTLSDLVSYNDKHEANGKDNRDGHGHNLSANYGVEGPTDIRSGRFNFNVIVTVPSSPLTIPTPSVLKRRLQPRVHGQFGDGCRVGQR